MSIDFNVSPWGDTTLEEKELTERVTIELRRRFSTKEHFVFNLDRVPRIPSSR